METRPCWTVTLTWPAAGVAAPTKNAAVSDKKKRTAVTFC
jgi:hypothetical protein